MVLSECRIHIAFEEFAVAAFSNSVAECIQNCVKAKLENGLQCIKDKTGSLAVFQPSLHGTRGWAGFLHVADSKSVVCVVCA